MSKTLAEMSQQLDEISASADTLIAERDRLREQRDALLPFARAVMQGGHHRNCKFLFMMDADESICNCGIGKAKAALKLCGISDERIAELFAQHVADED